jgi:hypothetical protein
MEEVHGRVRGGIVMHFPKYHMIKKGKASPVTGRGDP